MLLPETGTFPLAMALRTSVLRSRRRIEPSLMSRERMSLMSAPVRLLSFTRAPVMRVAAVAVVAPTASAVATQAPMVFMCCHMGATTPWSGFTDPVTTDPSGL